MDVFTYRPGEVVLSICGYTLEGWSSISVAQSSPVFKQIKGIRGKHTRVKLQDKAGTFKITLTQTSIANDVLSELLTLDSATGTARLEVVLKDTAGTSLFSSTTAYIEGFPEVTFSASQSERNWTILCDSMDSHFVGGNAEQGVDLASIISRLGI
jgi:hypothetical protein